MIREPIPGHGPEAGPSNGFRTRKFRNTFVKTMRNRHSCAKHSPPRRGGEARQLNRSWRAGVVSSAETFAALTTPSAPSAHPPLLCEEGNVHSLLLANWGRNLSMSIRRNMKPIRFATVIFAATALIGVAQAQSSYSCVNDAPNPYKQVTGWANMPRAWAATNNVFVDGKDNVWVMDRCEDKGCQGSHEAPIWELSPDGKVLKNFGADMFLFPHTVKPDAEGNVWAIDGDAREGKGNQVFKLSPDGKVLMTLGKAGQGGKGPDVFDRPT